MTVIRCELDCIHRKDNSICNQDTLLIQTTHTCETRCIHYTQAPNKLHMQLVVSRIQLIKDSMQAICDLCDEPGDMSQVIAEKFPFAYSLEDVVSEVAEWQEAMEVLHEEAKKNA